MSLIGSWVYQLAVQSVPVFEKVKSTYNKTNDDRVATETEVWNLFSFSLSVVDGCYLVVDGFDELTNQHDQGRSRRAGARDALLGNLIEVLSKEARSTHVHLAIVSRQEPNIKRLITEASNRELTNVQKHHIDPSDNSQDLQAFCQRLIDEAVGDMEESFRLDLAQKMADRSDGMMLWPYLVSKEQLERGYIELAHFSTKEFILGNANVSSIRFRESHSHGHLAAACLTYFAWQGFEDSNWKDQRSLTSMDDAQLTRLYTHCTDETGFFFYCHLWIKHGKKSLANSFFLWLPIITYVDLAGPDRFRLNWWVHFTADGSPHLFHVLGMFWFEVLTCCVLLIIGVNRLWRLLPGLLFMAVFPIGIFIHGSLRLASRNPRFRYRKGEDTLQLLSALCNFWARVGLVAFLSFLNCRHGPRQKAWLNLGLVVQLATWPWSWPTAHGRNSLCPIILPLKITLLILTHAGLILASLEGTQWLTWSSTAWLAKWHISLSFWSLDNTALIVGHLFGERRWALLEEHWRWSQDYVVKAVSHDHPAGEPFTISNRITVTIISILLACCSVLYAILSLAYGEREPFEVWMKWKN